MPLPTNLDLQLVDSIDQAWAMKTWLGERRPDQVLGFDTETHGLDLYASHGRLRMVQLGDGEKGWAVPWDQWGGVALECMKLWKGDFTAHNLSFDAKAMRVFADYDIQWSRFHDTMIMAQIAAPGAPAALKVLTDKFVDPRASIGQKRLDNAFKNHGWGWDTVPINYEDYWVYSALDPVLAVHLYNHFSYVITEYPKVYDLEMAVRHICTEMEHTGMRLDLNYVQEKRDELSAKIIMWKQWAEDNWGFSVSSTPQIAAFFKAAGGRFDFHTPKGADSVNKEQLDAFSKSDNPVVAQAAEFILNVRKYEKLNSSYFENFLIMHDDGVLHPSIRTLGARTGRMSVTNPALQTLPSGDRLIRSAFIRRNEGDVLISCDYSQMELRLLAHYSKDPHLIAAFDKADNEVGGDFFNEIGKSIFKAENFDRHTEQFKKQGKAIKTLMYGLIYGASVRKLSEQAKIPLDEMQIAYDGLIAAFPGIASFMKETIQLGEYRERAFGVGYVELDSGRRLPSDPDKAYTLTNYILQGTGAELTKRALVRLDAAGLGPYLQMAVHDEVILSIPEEDAEAWLPTIQECMSFVDGEFLVPLPAVPEIYGERWGDGYSEVSA